MLMDYLPSDSCEAFIHDHVRPVLCDVILKTAMQYSSTYVAVHSINEVLLVKPPIYHAPLLLLPAHQITMTQILDALTEPGYTAHLFSHH